jgi:hypothetical protein
LVIKEGGLVNWVLRRKALKALTIQFPNWQPWALAKEEKRRHYGQQQWLEEKTNDFLHVYIRDGAKAVMNG